MPSPPPPIILAAGGPRAARVAAESGDGLMAIEPDPGLVATWRQAGGEGPRYAEVALCFAADEAAAIALAHDRFRFGALGWKIMNELANPENFEAATPELERAGGVALGIPTDIASRPAVAP